MIETLLNRKIHSTVQLIKEEKILSIFLFLIFIYFILHQNHRTGDFRVFIEAALDILKGKNIYAVPYELNPLKKDSILYYYYSPLFALLLTPLTFLPHFIVYASWKALNIFFLYRLWKIFQFFIPFQDLDIRERNYLTLFSFLFISFFIYINFHNLQMTIFLLYLTLEGISFIIIRKKTFYGAILIALAVNIKLLSIVIIPYLIYRSYFKSVFYITIFTLVFLFLPAVFIGWNYNLELIYSWVALLNQYNDLKLIDRDVHGLTANIPILLMNYEDKLFSFDFKRNILDLSANTVVIILNGLRVFFIFFTLYFLRTRPFKKVNNKFHIFWELSYLFSIVPLVFPQQRRYSFFLVFPAITYIIYFYLQWKKGNTAKLENWKIKTVLYLAIPIFLLFNLELYLGHFRTYYWYFKTLTYGALLLIVPLSICRPSFLVYSKKISQNSDYD